MMSLSALSRERVRVRSGSAKRKLLVLLVVVLGLLIFAPTIVMNTSLRERIITGIVPPEAAKVNPKSLTVGWLTPLTASDISVVDPEGNRLADIGKLSIDRTVIGFLSSGDNLGTIRLEDVTLYALVDPTGSNLERAIAAAAKSKAEDQDDQLPGADDCKCYKLELVNCRLLSRDAVTGETWSADSIAATVDHAATGTLNIEATGVVRAAPADMGGPAVAAAAANGGRFELTCGQDDASGLRRVRLVCQDVPVEAIDPWMQRFDQQFQSTGLLTGELSASYPQEHYDSLSGETSGRIALRQFAVTGAALEGEQLAVDETNLAWKCLASGGQVSVENLSFASDVANFDMRGTVDERAVRSVAAGESKPIALATHGDLQANGRLDLARLAQRLPQYFQIREGTTITSGEAEFAARSMPRQDGHHVTASLTTTPLVGTANGRVVEWDTPLEIDVVAMHAGEQWRFDRLACQSQFLTVSGSGSSSRMQLTGQMDLDELASRLGPFVDLAEWQLAGRAEVTATTERNSSGRFVSDASGELQNFVIAYQGEQLASEPALEWTWHGVGVAPPDSLRPERLDVAEIGLSAAGDSLQVQLSQPVIIEPLWSATNWPVKISTRGNLDRWSRRLRPAIDLSKWKMAGDLELVANGSVRTNPPTVSIASSDMKINGLRATSETLMIDEPRVEWKGDIAWDSVTRTLVSRNGQLVSSSVASSFRDWFWTADPKQTSNVGGIAAVRVDLARLANIRRLDPASPPRMTPVGQMSGKVTLNAQGDEVVAGIDMTGQNIQLRKPQPTLPGATPVVATIWQEPQLRVVGTLGYNAKSDRLRIDGLQTTSNTLAIAGSGRVDSMSSDQLVNLSGSIDYDLESLTPIIAQYLGEGFAIVGREQARFEFQGKLGAAQPVAASTGVPATVVANVTSESPPWQGSLLAPWQSASFFGLPIGQGRVSAKMQSGKVSIEPFDFAVGGGRFTAAPAVELEPAPGKLTLPAGPLLTNIRITPDVSERMVRYMVPVLSGATRTEGVFSLNLSGASVPFGQPDKADVAGQLAVQSIRMVPGPNSAGLVNLVRQVEASISAGNLLAPAPVPNEPVTLIAVTDRTIDFRLVDGRVYHQGLEFQVGRWLVRSRGSVGLDETLSLILELQVPQQGVGSKLREIGITTIEIPASGSLRNWKFDTRRVLRNVGQQLLKEETIGNALDRLFGGDRNRD